ncbi:DUF6192 family protein [Streptomyces xantholiticus]|uniref:DUF6192 family protein n=1 Tax=Streptomyces xantholiticus TaxID=68285 RepID=UPI00198486C8|nr:DUF6192 family protein [Streptomyces xantholiticus]GGW70050.1 hypothetical protein GCM10010381_63590 [Streptomyces xantholiticus]
MPRYGRRGSPRLKIAAADAKRRDQHAAAHHPECGPYGRLGPPFRTHRLRRSTRRTSPVSPAVRKFQRTETFVDLLGAFHRFVRETSKAVPKAAARPAAAAAP